MSSAQQLLQDAADNFKANITVAEEVNAMADIITDFLKQGGKIFFCSNGGSTGDAQHLEAEFLGRFLKERQALSAIALTTNASAVTAIANDYGYVEVFSRQLAGLAKAGDVLDGISTSGNSSNVIKAFHTAKEHQVKISALTGQKASDSSAVADIAIRVPSTHTPRIQEMHIAVGHTLCEIAEKHLTYV